MRGRLELTYDRDRDDPARRGAGERPRGGGPATGEPDAQRLLDELRVHQVELELQNEELRATRQALEDSLHRYTELFDFAPIGWLVVGVDAVIRELNFAAARLLGIDRALAAGRRLETFLAEAEASKLVRFLAAVLTAGETDAPPGPVESVLRAAGPRVVRITGACMRGEPHHTALLALEDVTARRVAEDALRETLHRRDDFLGTLSHELRNPLAPIRNALEILRRSPPAGDLAARAVAVIDRQSGHLARLVDDLLDVTRIARGKIQLRLEVLDLRSVVRRTVDDHRAAFEGADVALEVRLPKAPCWVHADGTRLAQILGNLLGNSLKFTARGGRVTVELRADGGAQLAVRDSGAGIDPKVLEQLFQPFSQGPQALARAVGGLGLGLATVKGLVELHGGHVVIASAGPGHGTTVTVSLPLTDAAAVAPAPAAPQATRRRILVVDDNVDGAETLKDVLETCGHEVRVAHDGPAALDAARRLAPDVIICDIGLPGMNGYDVARALRADAALRGVHLVALSGYARPEDVRRSLEAGFDQHVAKPPAIDELLAAAPTR